MTWKLDFRDFGQGSIRVEHQSGVLSGNFIVVDDYGEYDAQWIAQWIIGTWKNFGSMLVVVL